MGYKALNAAYGYEQKQHRDEYYTPLWLIQALGEFDLDPACGALCPNRTAKRRYQVRGLERPWSGRVWLNPPFSNASQWLEKLADHGRGTALVCVSGNCKWFQKALLRAGGIFFVGARLEFGRPDGSQDGCPMMIALLAFGPRDKQKLKNSALKGIWLEVA